MPDNIGEIDELLDLEEIYRREKRILARLLDARQRAAGHHLVFQVRMGEVESYLTSVTLGWVAEKVGFANDLPVFKKDEEGSDSAQSFSFDLEMKQQRDPDWTRQRDMAAYLASRRHHKFPALLLVGYQGWVYDKRSEKWGEDSRAMSDSLTLGNLDTTGMCWELNDADTNFYALDGQHRLMAIRGLSELIKEGQLPAKDKQGKIKSAGALWRDEIVELIEQAGDDRIEAHDRLQRLMDERIGIEIIPAIRRNESEEEGRQRLRQMFVDVNENAKRLTKGQLSQLDESTGFRVVARRLVSEHPFLRSGTSADGEARPKVETVKTQLSNEDCYTTLDTLVEIVRAYLTEDTTLAGNKKYVSWDNVIAKGVSIRPKDSVLYEATKDMTSYFDLLAEIPSHKAFTQGKPAGEIRGAEPGDDNILFRPLAQMVLAEVVGLLAARGVSPKSVVRTLAEKEIEGQLKLTDRKTPWFGVLCDVDGKMRRYKKNRDLCCRLLVFLLGGGVEDDVERERLRKDFAEQRLIDPEQRTAIDLAGKAIKEDEIQLPNPWR